MQQKPIDNFVETPIAGNSRSHRRVSTPQGDPLEMVQAAELLTSNTPESSDAILDRLMTTYGIEGSDASTNSPDSPAAESDATEHPATAEETGEIEDSPEQAEKKKHRLIRIGQAALINFRVIQEVGVKAYAGDLADRAVETVDNKVDSIKDDIYKQIEKTFQDIEDDVNSTARSIREQYALTMGPIESSIDAYKDMRRYKRELAQYEKAKREQAIKDRSDAIKHDEEVRRLAKKAPGL